MCKRREGLGDESPQKNQFPLPCVMGYATGLSLDRLRAWGQKEVLF